MKIEADHSGNLGDMVCEDINSFVKAMSKVIGTIHCLLGENQEDVAKDLSIAEVGIIQSYVKLLSACIQVASLSDYTEQLCQLKQDQIEELRQELKNTRSELDKDLGKKVAK